MALSPRFHRVAALQRRFVDREPILEAFAEELARVGSGPRVFNVTGVGGIGKSRLLRELRDRAAPDHRTAAVDLQVPSFRQAEDALAVLRRELGAQGVRFDRFDIAYAVLWQRLHPHLRVSRDSLSFIDDSSILTDIFDSVSGLPVFGTARGLVKILERGSSDLRRRARVRRDADLQTLDDLPNAELADAVTYLFAEDFRAASATRPFVIVIDSYEALVPAPVRGGRGHLADAWLRDLVAQLDRGLVVIASREPLRWELNDADWEPLIRVCDVDGLPMEARIELLGSGGITETAQQRLIADASAGLPFYLNLAVDTFEQTGGRLSGQLVSQQEILARFLQHVAPEEIRSLEILSPARIFDYEIFRLLTAAFHLPTHRLAWESLTAYSFVYPAEDALRLHQLMRSAVRERLSDAAAYDIHTLLRDLWDGRASQDTADGSTMRARAVREAAFHALHTGQTSGADVLDYADRAVRRGGHSAAAGIGDDLAAWLADPARFPGDELSEALTCLRAEAAVRLGDAAAVLDLAPSATALEAAVETTVGTRLAIAAGHGRRIAGDTAAALDLYGFVWEHGRAGARLAAGLWAADLHMSQGRFRDAESLTGALEIFTPPEDAELRGDIARLRHLSHRFAFDFDAARHYLDEAESHYRDADSVLGLANVATNWAELSALTGAPSAVTDAGRAIEIQREIGAQHELGKAYTALAVARLRDGRLDEADTALRSAFDALDRAGYRSGRARAEFYQALLHARRGYLDEAIPTLRHAVAELEGAEVYPTVILAADRALSALDITDERIAAAARRARAAVQPFGDLRELDDRITRFVRGLLDGHVSKPAELYNAATRNADPASGFYNYNIRLDVAPAPVIVRIPIPGSDIMDLTVWPEADVLRAIRGTVHRGTRLLFASDRPRFLVLEYISGRLLDGFAPRGTPVPGHVIGDVLELFSQLGQVPRERLPRLPADWPADGGTTGFARRLSALTAAVHARFVPEFGDLFSALGIPTSPLTAVERGWEGLHRRPFRLAHTDIHRKNIIVNNGRSYFLDWELALWGDPVYDLAVHLHKMSYQADETAAVLSGWAAAVPTAVSEGWQADLDVYLAHERVKSAVVDTVRYTKLITSGNLAPRRQAELVDKLAAKLAAAQAGWEGRGSPDPATTAAIIEQWARGRRP
jgi:tetratricopeptide (TPR) repeat protein